MRLPTQPLDPLAKQNQSFRKRRRGLGAKLEPDAQVEVRSPKLSGRGTHVRHGAVSYGEEVVTGVADCEAPNSVEEGGDLLEFESVVCVGCALKWPRPKLKFG